ncbi:hypothetical protein D3C85_1090560 [compost metagenome]
MLLTFVVQHFRFFLMVFIDQSQFYKKLTAITDTHRKRILTFEEILQCYPCFFIV